MNVVLVLQLINLLWS